MDMCGRTGQGGWKSHRGCWVSSRSAESRSYWSYLWFLLGYGGMKWRQRDEGSGCGRLCLGLGWEGRDGQCRGSRREEAESVNGLGGQQAVWSPGGAPSPGHGDLRFCLSPFLRSTWKHWPVWTAEACHSLSSSPSSAATACQCVSHLTEGIACKYLLANNNASPMFCLFVYSSKTKTLHQG